MHYKVEVIVESDRSEAQLEMYAMGLLMRGTKVKEIRATEVAWSPQI